MPIQHIIGRAQQDAAIKASRLTWSQLFHSYVTLYWKREKITEFQAVAAELRKRRDAEE